jgi:hypothetical protein
MINRRQFLAAGTACIAAAFAESARAAKQDGPVAPLADAGAGFELTIQPGRIYKRTSDQNRLRHDHWLFTLLLLSTQPRKPNVESLTVSYLSRGATRQTATWPQSVASALDLVSSVPVSPVRERYPVAAFQIADSIAGELEIDGARCELVCRTDVGQQRIERTIPIEAYVQKTQLIFPFEGRGMITQGGAWNDGHRNRSGMFAVDAIGLTALHAAMVGQGDAPEVVAGWGRPIIAPAAGEVVVARKDRPDQPITGVSDPKYFVPEFPQGGDPGNHLVIDHGSGEFSMLAHLQHGSVRVRVGDRVAQRQVLGLLGNSGDSNTPHVHHQLQSGAQWTGADALPHTYTNGPERQHDRGVIFLATQPPD